MEYGSIHGKISNRSRMRTSSVPQNETPFREGGFVRLGRSEENPRPWFLMAKGNSVEFASDLTSLLPSLLPSPAFPATAVCHHHREE